MKHQKLIIRIVGVALCVGLLILLRKYQGALFYDPLVDFFANDNTQKVVPAYDAFAMYSNIILRYNINSAISIGILYLIFQNKSITVSAIKVYTIIGLVFFVLYLVTVEYYFPLGETFTFYIRRFLIHPLLLLILIPAYYYMVKTEKNFR